MRISRRPSVMKHRAMNNPHGGRRDNRKRRPDDKRGGARPGAGRPRLLTVRVPLTDAPALLDWLRTHQPPASHPARRGWDFVAAGLWSEEVRTKQE